MRAAWEREPNSTPDPGGRRLWVGLGMEGLSALRLVEMMQDGLRCIKVGGDDAYWFRVD